MFFLNKITCKGSLFLFLNLYLLFLNLASAATLNSTNALSKIDLVGTITGKHALAILRLQNHSEGIYQINQKISGYTVTVISKKSVVLTKNKKSYTLALVAVANRHFYDINDNTSKKTTLATYEYRINRNTFNSLRYDTQSWLDNVRLEMQVENGYFSGYIMTYIRKNSPAELLGLTEGDVIKGINGILIKQNTEYFINNISQLTNARQFTLNMRHKETDFNLKFLIDGNDKNIKTK